MALRRPPRAGKGKNPPKRTANPGNTFFLGSRTPRLLGDRLPKFTPKQIRADFTLPIERILHPAISLPREILELNRKIVADYTMKKLNTKDARVREFNARMKKYESSALKAMSVYESLITERCLKLAFRAAGDPPATAQQQIRKVLHNFQQSIIRQTDWEREMFSKGKKIPHRSYRNPAIRQRFQRELGRVFGSSSYSEAAMRAFLQTFDLNANKIMGFYLNRYATDTSVLVSKRISLRFRTHEIMFNLGS